jgi:hypothetical protein
MFNGLELGEMKVLHHLTDGVTDHRLAGKVTKLTKTFATFGDLRPLGWARTTAPTEVKIRKENGLADNATNLDGYRLLLEE